MAASVDIWTERDNWRGPLGWSVALHASFVAIVLIYGAVIGTGRGAEWGGGGGGGVMSARMVASIPLPSQPNATNVVATESKGLSQTQPRVQEKTPDAIPIPEREAKRKAWEKAPTTVDKRYTKPVTTASNVIPFGQGGPLAGPYSVFSAGGAKGGFGFSGGGGGDFGNRYSWYVRVVQQKVSENWLKYEIDPNITQARRVYITFDILRNGQPTNIEIEQSSGVPSLDQSAVRALQRIDTFGPLPADYSGSRVSVEFWFDYKR